MVDIIKEALDIKGHHPGDLPRFLSGIFHFIGRDGKSRVL